MIRPARPSHALAAIVQALAVALALATSVAAAATQPPRTSATGAHRYKLVLLLTGERPPIPPQVAESLQAGHMANINHMFHSGALDAAGPFGDKSPLRGLFVFHSEDADLDTLLAPDPLLHAGRLRAQAHTWVAPEGLGAPYRNQGTIDPGGRDSMVTFSFVLLRRGPRWTANATPGLSHMLEAQAKQLERWHRDGVLRMAGPIEGTGDLRGVYIFDADSASTASRVARDPAVKAGRLVAEIHPWWTAYGIVPGP